MGRSRNKKTPKPYRFGSFGGAGGRTRTGTVSLPVDFESTTSANSITPAKLTRVIIQYYKYKIKCFFAKTRKFTICTQNRRRNVLKSFCKIKERMF